MEAGRETARNGYEIWQIDGVGRFFLSLMI
jgi:hypothetical protein